MRLLFAIAQQSENRMVSLKRSGGVTLNPNFAVTLRILSMLLFRALMLLLWMKVSFHARYAIERAMLMIALTNETMLFVFN